jgi:anti-sigma B factor antagonist
MNQREVGDIVVLDLNGHLSLGDELNDLNRLITDLLAAGKTRLVLNLKKVDYVDSSGAGTLVRCYSAAKQAGGDLRLAQPTDRFLKVLDLTHLTKVLPIFASEDEALRDFA